MTRISIDPRQRDGSEPARHRSLVVTLERVGAEPRLKR
jgi:hypothetical protein